MFAPLVAKPQTKPAEPQRSAIAAQRPGRTAPAQAQLLQRTIGNQALTRLLAQRAGAASNAPGPIQAKLKVGAVNDPLEHEADRVADQVMRMPAPDVSAAAAPSQVSRKCADCEGEEKLQRKSAGPQIAGGEAPAIVHEVLRSPGQPLHTATRGFFEPRFGRDFSGVRVHTNGQAANSAEAIQAQAYTAGSDIVFAGNQFSPATAEGNKLLAHELTHVVQQQDPAAAAAVRRMPAKPISQDQTDDSTFEEAYLKALQDKRAKPARPPKSGPQLGPMPLSAKHPSLSRTLRVAIIAHASPRWRDAASNTEADRLNEMLARKRAAAVQAEVEHLLHERLGKDVPITLNVTLAEDEPPRGIEVGAVGVGSRQTLEAAKGDRRRDDEYFRRVEVQIEMVESQAVTAGRSQPAIPALSQDWRITVNELEVISAYGAVGHIDLKIKSGLTGKEVVGTAELLGLGRPDRFSIKEDTGEGDKPLKTRTAVGFEAFEGTSIHVTKADVRLFIGVSSCSLDFPELSYGTIDVYTHFSIGFPSGFFVWGDLHLMGDTSDYINPVDFVHSTAERRSTEGLIIAFPTGHDGIAPSERDRLDNFVSMWSRRLGWP